MPHDALEISFGIDSVLFIIFGIPSLLFCIWKIYRDMTAVPRRWVAVYAAGLAGILFILLTSRFGTAGVMDTFLSSLVVFNVLTRIPLFLFMLCFCGLHVCRSLCFKPHRLSVGFTLVFVVLLFVGFKGFEWDRTWVPPQRIALETVNVRQKNYSLKDVWAFEIPERVFSKLDLYPKAANYLTGNKKHLVFVYTPCKWSNLFQEKLEKLAATPVFQKNYDLTILSTYPNCYASLEASCNTKEECARIEKEMRKMLNFNASYCPEEWAHTYCGNGICIVNPRTKEIIADYSQEITQFLVLLEAYADWDKEPLLNPQK